MATSKQVVFSCAFMVVFLYGPLRSWSQSSADPKVIEGAKKEREVVWYTTTNLETSKKISDLLQKKYPFLNVTLFRTNNAPLVNRILLEARAGKYEWDVVSGGGELFSPVMDRGLIMQYRSAEARMIDEDMVDKEGYWTAYTASTFVLGFNTKMVKKEAVPRTYEALLDPKWKGRKIGVDASAGMLHALMPSWGKEKAISYFRQLASQDPAPNDSTSLMAQLLSAGELPLAFSTAHIYELLNRKGAPVDWIPLEPAVIRVVPTMLGAKARHPNAGKLLYDFLIAKEGQEIIKSFNRIPVRKDVPPDPPRLLRGFKRVIMYPELYKSLDETQRIYNEIFKLR
ncbi:MAG: extracellular solute-binding protein [Deltaproteobacteria bacterium]|nr:extracellular solute-binding protein [Deltaproteobacteria bacterium]